MKEKIYSRKLYYSKNVGTAYYVAVSLKNLNNIVLGKSGSHWSKQ